jgi:hypothetical protein
MGLMSGLVEFEAEHTSVPHQAVRHEWTRRSGWAIALGFSISFWLIVGAVFVLG